MKSKKSWCNWSLGMQLRYSNTLNSFLPFVFGDLQHKGRKLPSLQAQFCLSHTTSRDTNPFVFINALEKGPSNVLGFLPPVRRVQRGKLSVSADKMFSRNAFYCIRNSVNNGAGHRKLEYPNSMNMMDMSDVRWGIGCNWLFSIFL